MTVKTYVKNGALNPFGEEAQQCACCSPLGEWVCAAERVVAMELPAGPLPIIDLPPCWADLLDALEAAESSTAKANRLAAEEAAAEERRLSGEAAAMAAYADLKKVTCSVGKGAARHIKKVAFPCKWLYCDDAAPRSQWRKNETGQWCAPRRNHLTGGECWAHEYTDPKRFKAEKARLIAKGMAEAAAEAQAKVFAHVVKHNCDHLHPGEAGWLPQWNTNARFRPDRVGEGLAAMRGVSAVEAARWASSAAARSVAAPAPASGGDGWTAAKPRKDNSAW
jgi:hypothetical protein